MTTTENDVSSGAETEITAPELQPNPEVAAPEPTEEGAKDGKSAEQQPEKTAEQKELERLRRQLTKRDRTQGKLYQELQQTRAELESFRGRGGAGDGDESLTLTKQELQEMVRQQAEELAAQRTPSPQQQEHDKKAEALVQLANKDPQFQEAVKEVIADLGLFDKGRPTDRMAAILDSDAPQELIRHLHDNPDLLEELSGMSTPRLARRLERIELELKAAKAPKTSAAPKPIKPVGGPAVSSDEYSPSMTNAQFDAWRARQIAARRK